MDRVDFAVPSTTHVPDSGPTVASRTVMVVGVVVEAAARALVSKIEGDRQKNGGSFDDAADRLLAAAGDAHGRAGIRAAARPRLGRRDLPGDAYPVYGWACDVAEVEVDLDTFETKVRLLERARRRQGDQPDPLQGPDRGRDPPGDRLGAHGEPREREGRVLNPRMTNYIIPTILDAPPFTTILVEAPYSRGPGGGAKGVGELPMDGGAPAVAAAVEHATGLVRDRLPLLPEDLLALSKEASGDHAHPQRRPVALEAPPAARLLDVLRGPLGLTGTKEGCGEGECGSCTVLLDGVPVNACLVPFGQCEGRSVTTVEGLGDAAHLSPLQEAFVTEGGAQCGICTPGMLISAEALLAAKPQPDEAEIREAIAGNVCRCTGYQRIVEAVRAAAKERARVSVAELALHAFEMPRDLAEAARRSSRRAGKGEKTVLLAGGTDWFVEQHVAPPAPAGTSRSSSTSRASTSSAASGRRRAGADRRRGDVPRAAAGRVVSRRAPLLTAMARDVGALQIQARGTLGGNLASGSPAADGVAALAALDATSSSRASAASGASRSRASRATGRRRSPPTS